jgi:uncharacterized protein (UPF0261 family)
MGRSILVIGTLDTKGDEVGYLREQIAVRLSAHEARRGHETIVMDVGILGEHALQANVTRQEVTGGEPGWAPDWWRQVDAHINEPLYAETAVALLEGMMEGGDAPIKSGQCSAS